MRKLMSIGGVLLLSAALTASLPAQANDSTFGDQNGGIVLLQQGDISMAREHLLLSQERVEVDYTFINHGAESVTLPVAFPMPPIYLGESDHSEIQDFALYVEGQKQRTEKRLVVMLDGKDITAKMERLGWTRAALLNYLYDDKVPAGVTPMPQVWFDEDKRPRFTLQDYFVWQQTFPSGQPINIRHTYTPSLSSSVPLPADDIIHWHQKSSCIDRQTAESIRRRVHPEMGVRWASLDYILITGKNWKNGVIGDFTLQIRKSKPQEILSLCFDGELQKIDALTFEFKQQNYRPQHDLNLLFVSKPGEE